MCERLFYIMKYIIREIINKYFYIKYFCFHHIFGDRRCHLCSTDNQKSDSSTRLTNEISPRKISINDMLNSIVNFLYTSLFLCVTKMLQKCCIISALWKSVNGIGPSKDFCRPIASKFERIRKIGRQSNAGKIVEDPLPNNVRWLANASDANDKQTNRGLSWITAPRGVLRYHSEPGSIPRSLVPNIIHCLSLPFAIAYATPTPPLTCQVRDAVPVIRWREALTNAIRKTALVRSPQKRNACLCIHRCYLYA